NWWVSFIISKNSSGFPYFFSSEQIDILFSNELLSEINNTLSYKRITKRVNEYNYRLFLLFVENSAIIIETTSNIDFCRDPKDNFLLALAKDAGADYLITRDEDLLILRKFESTAILTLNQFIEIINTI
ncbi:MAG: putative toxin-antitoxin system toxin component, PIN family, partial [Panacibacter sp.]